MSNRTEIIRKAKGYIRFSENYSRPEPTMVSQVSHEGREVLDTYWDEIERNPLFSRRLDGVVVATGPANWMEMARADSAVNAVRELYGDLDKYTGPWIVSGDLGEDENRNPIPYEESQRKDIVERLKSHGVPEERITITEGVNTRDKVRCLVDFANNNCNLFPTVCFRYIGIASYHYDIARWNLALNAAKDEQLLSAEHTYIVGIPIKGRPLADYFKRPMPDWLVGLKGLKRDAELFEEKGFLGATKAPSSNMHKLARALNSEKPLQRFGDK